MGHCYGQLRMVDEQIEFYERARQADPSWLEPRLGLAAAYHSIQNFDRAIEEYRALDRLFDVSLMVGLRFARTLIEKNFEADGASQQQGWVEIESLLTKISDQIDNIPRRR